MQLEFLWRDNSSLRRDLEVRTGERIELTVTDNSSSIMSFKSAAKGRPARLRIHHMFLSAGPDVLGALATWLTKRNCQRSAQVLDDFIKRNGHLIVRNRERPIDVTTRGTHFDLQRLYDEINRAHFEDSVNAPITWGRMPTTRKRRSIRLGSFTPEDNVIRVHPLLDQAFVPEYFVRYIVFHEMLHAHLGIETSSSGRRCIHTPAFKRMERAYPDYDRAIGWHDDPKNLRKLLRTPRDAA